MILVWFSGMRLVGWPSLYRDKHIITYITYCVNGLRLFLGVSRRGLASVHRREVRFRHVHFGGV